MQFTPKSEKEIYAPTYEPGTYKFRVIDASEEISKKGNEMIKITLEVSDGVNAPTRVNDFILNIDKSHYKLLNFCKAIGKVSLYESGNIGVFDIKEQRGKANFHYEEYEGRHYLKVKDYLEKKENTLANDEQQPSDPDDDIPF